jgi:hypothetical protein
VQTRTSGPTPPLQTCRASFSEEVLFTLARNGYIPDSVGRCIRRHLASVASHSGRNHLGHSATCRWRLTKLCRSMATSLQAAYRDPKQTQDAAPLFELVDRKMWVSEKGSRASDLCCTGRSKIATRNRRSTVTCHAAKFWLRVLPVCGMEVRRTGHGIRLRRNRDDESPIDRRYRQPSHGYPGRPGALP